MRSRVMMVMGIFVLMTGLAGCATSTYHENSGAWSASAYVPPPVPEPTWSPWAKLDDGGLNGIEFSHKDNCGKQGSATPCTHNWRFNSLYETDVDLEYTIAWDSGAGVQKKTVRTRLKPGENRDDSFAVNAVALDELSVRLIADTRVLADARNTVAETRAAEQREIERKRQQVELIARLAAEEQQRQEEARRQQQAAEAEYWRLHPEEYQARLAQQRNQEQERQERRREQAEERRREEEQEERRHEREETRRYNEQARKDRDSIMSSFSQPDMISNALKNQNQQYDAIREQNRQREEQQRREKEERAREAREEQRRQAEYAAQQQRDAEENRRLQQQRALESERTAQERQEKAERERVAKEAEKKAAAAKLVKEQAERDKQKKQLAQNNANQYTENSSGSYALTAEQRKIQLQQLAQAQQKQQTQAPQQQQPTQQTQPPETCPPQIWDEYNNDRSSFAVYVLNTCQRSRLEVTSINYYDHENVLCNTMLMPDRFQPGSKVMPMDCRKFVTAGQTWKFPGYKVNYRIVD